MAGTIVVDRIESDASYASDITFSTASAERMRIDYNGVLSIGSTSYASVASATAMTPRLQLHGTSLGTSAFAQYAWNSTNSYHTFNTSGTGGLGVHAAVTSGDTLGNIQFNGSDGTSFIGGASIKAIPEGTISTGVMPSNLRFYTAAPTTGTLTERMRINSSGYMSIGNAATASSLLHLYSADSTAYDGSATDGQLTAGATQLIQAAAGSNTNVAQLVFQARASQPYNRIVSSGGSAPFMAFVTNNAERMRIDSSGNVLVGNTTQVSTERFSVGSGSNTITAWFQQNTNTSAYNGIVIGLGSNGNNTSSSFLRGNTNTVGNWYLWGNGTTTFTSDQRLKKNIETTRNGYLEDLAKLRVVKYNWWKDDDSTPKELGLIAQEVAEVFPNLIMDDPSRVSPDDETVYKSLKQSVLPFMLLKAIQELKAIVDEQALKISALESK